MIQTICVLNDLSQGEIPWQNNIIPGERDDQESLNHPWTDAGNGCETCFDILIRQLLEGVGAQASVDETVGYSSERCDFSPGQSDPVQIFGRSGKHIGRGRQPSAEAFFRAQE